MKHLGKRILCSILTFVMLLSVMCMPAYAAERSSAYLSSYMCSLTAKSGGRIVVTVEVDAVGSVDEVGASSIHIYESTDNVTFEWAASYYADDYPEFLESGTDYYEDAITYYGVPGRYYKANVYVHAGDETGSDTTLYTTVSCRAIS